MDGAYDVVEGELFAVALHDFDVTIVGDDFDFESAQNLQAACVFVGHYVYRFGVALEILDDLLDGPAHMDFGLVEVSIAEAWRVFGDAVGGAPRRYGRIEDFAQRALGVVAEFAGVTAVERDHPWCCG